MLLWISELRNRNIGSINEIFMHIGDYNIQKLTLLEQVVLSI